MSRKTRAMVIVAPLVTAVGLVMACVQTQRALDESCLKDQDCLSGICSQLKCAAAPPLLDGAPQGTPTPDAAGTDAPADVAPEAATVVDAAPEAAPEAAPDAPPADGPGE